MNYRLSPLLFSLCILATHNAWGQSSSAHPTGTFTPGHPLRSNTTSGSPYSDAGGAAGSDIFGNGYLTELGITAPGLPFCINDALTSGPYHRMCLGHGADGSGLITVDGLNGASSIGLNVEINGQTFPIPGPGMGDMVGPVTIGAVGNTPLYNTATTLIDGGPAASVSLLDTRFGGRCDGTNSDSTALALAIDSFGGHGGKVKIPHTGHTCVLATGITLPSNVTIEGDGISNWTATDDTPANVAASGSWFQCKDLVNPCIDIPGVGSAVRHVGFVYAQPAPAPGWSPTIYPYTIVMDGSANFSGIEDITITGASHCVYMNGPNSGVAGIYTYMHDVRFNGCWKVGTRFEKIDNTVYMSNLRYAPYWNLANANYQYVSNYYQANAVGWDLHYLANAQADGIEFWQHYRAIQAQNGTVVSGFGAVTFAANELQLTNVSFNEVCQALSMPNGNGTWFSAVMTNSIIYGNTASNCFAGLPMFDLASDAANMTMIAPRVGYVDTFANVGHGAGGGLKFIGGDISKYAAVTAGSHAFGVSANSSFTLLGTPYRSIRPNTGAGSIIGPGVDATQGYEEPIQVGACGSVGTPGQGCVTMESSQNNTTAGSTSYFLPDGSRAGFVGRSTTATKELNVQADSGPVNITPAAGKLVNLQAPVAFGTSTVAGLPACDAAHQSSHVTVSDQAASPVYGAAPTGGGGLSVVVTCTNGVGWRLQ